MGPKRPPKAPQRSLGEYFEASELETNAFRRPTLARLAQEVCRERFFVDFSLVRESVEPHLDSHTPSRNEVRLFCERFDPLERNSIAKSLRSIPERDQIQPRSTKFEPRSTRITPRSTKFEPRSTAIAQRLPKTRQRRPRNAI